MKVLVTGGTGFVGGHLVAALAKGGHDIRMLVRRPEQVRATLDPLTQAEPEVVVGDVLDETSVAEAISGCDALVHAAAVYSFDPRRAEEMRRTNVRATQIALGAAIEGALDPVVHISSTVALTRRGGSDPSLPLGDIDLPYTQSKIDSALPWRYVHTFGYNGFMTAAVPLGDARDRLSELVSEVARTHERVTITRHGHPDAVLISPDDLASLEETVDILSRSDVAEAVREGIADAEAGRFADAETIKAKYLK